MNTIYEAPVRGFSELLAAVPIAAQARTSQKTREPENLTPTTNNQGTDLLKRQLTANENFWNMVVAESVRSNGTDSSQSEAVTSASAKAADAAMRLRLFSTYGTATTEAIAGRRDTMGVNPTGRVMVRKAEPGVVRSLEKSEKFSLAA